ncbi:MAG: GTP cyclohydrolase I FolE2 [Verrucomicrobiae bacterium]|nr:GTP cyclohydrolase I FolE2 [Verrucomicrobiae bacterium]MCP5534103.1 GTP cyclohydrolase I FolE2 [Akkermansiaceae bacterium]MCP5545204.1 GTP cyclohydrolase I FolE2 [Akkermansiaceae bacterium]
MTPPNQLPDIQATPDTRGIAIDQVGVSDLRYPIKVTDREGNPFPTVARISMSVHLPHHFKGTHMSRFLEVLSLHEGEVTSRTLPAILRDLRGRLNAEEAHMEVAFTYFVTKQAPVSLAPAKVACDCVFSGTSNGAGDELILSVTAPVTTLCPCSKEISDYGAHNQRGYVTIEVKPKPKGNGCELILIEDLIEIAEKSGSAPVYALLKRPDERHVTMQAYENPVFVEDVVRNAAALLRADGRVASFTVKAVNHESIHDHNAFAVISGTVEETN